MDMRASVGVLDRTIKIQNGGDGWGFGVLIYAWQDGANFWNIGKGVVQGVQFVSGGQQDSLNAAFNVINTVAGSENILFKGNSMQACGAYCFYLYNSNNVTITNNFVFTGRKFLAYA